MSFALRSLSKTLFWMAAFMVLTPIASAAAVLQLAAAADLANCIDELNRGFVKSVGAVDIKTSIGSSGNFFAQIKNGAPFDVFLSADTDYPRELAKAGLAEKATLLVYSHGQLVMWSVDPALDPGIGLRLLNDPRIQHIAIANPDIAPYGRAAKAMLQRAGIWESIKHKLVFGENIAQTAQFIETGNAQVGFVGIGYAKTGKNSKGRTWQVPGDIQPLIEQGGIVTAKGRGNPLSIKYLDFLRAEEGRSILRKCGFVLPEARP